MIDLYIYFKVTFQSNCMGKHSKEPYYLGILFGESFLCMPRLIWNNNGTKQKNHLASQSMFGVKKLGSNADFSI